nr:hypothetical protein [Tanacetum cinerariifolium]
SDWLGADDKLVLGPGIERLAGLSDSLLAARPAGNGERARFYRLALDIWLCRRCHPAQPVYWRWYCVSGGIRAHAVAAAGQNSGRNAKRVASSK